MSHQGYYKKRALVVNKSPLKQDYLGINERKYSVTKIVDWEKRFRLARKLVEGY